MNKVSVAKLTNIYSDRREDEKTERVIVKAVFLFTYRLTGKKISNISIIGQLRSNALVIRLLAWVQTRCFWVALHYHCRRY